MIRVPQSIACSSTLSPAARNAARVTSAWPCPTGESVVHLLPPFDNVKMRQAVLNLVDQKDYMRAAAGDPQYWPTCVSFFACGGAFETKAGAEAISTILSPL